MSQSSNISRIFQIFSALNGPFPIDFHRFPRPFPGPLGPGNILEVAYGMANSMGPLGVTLVQSVSAHKQVPQRATRARSLAMEKLHGNHGNISWDWIHGCDWMWRLDVCFDINSWCIPWFIMIYHRCVVIIVWYLLNFQGEFGRVRAAPFGQPTASSTALPSWLLFCCTSWGTRDHTSMYRQLIIWQCVKTLVP